jgi:hypothetical protein
MDLALYNSVFDRLNPQHLGDIAPSSFSFGLLSGQLETLWFLSSEYSRLQIFNALLLDRRPQLGHYSCFERAMREESAHACSQMLWFRLV